MNPFDLPGTDPQNASYAVKKAVELIEDADTFAEGPHGHIVLPFINQEYVFADPIVLHKPIRFENKGHIRSLVADDALFTVRSWANSTGWVDNKGWHVDLGKCRGPAAPTVNINEGGATLLKLKNAEDCFFAFDRAEGFDRAAIYGEAIEAGDHVQGITVNFNMAANNGSTILTRSKDSATSAAQAWTVNAGSIHRNGTNIAIDTPMNGDVFSNSNNMQFNIGRMDWPQRPDLGGLAVDIQGSYCQIMAGFIEGHVIAQPGSFYNEIKAMNHATSGFTWSDLGTDNEIGPNRVQDVQLPRAVPIAAGAVYSNLEGVPLAIAIETNFAPGAEAAIQLQSASGAWLNVDKFTNATPGAVNMTLQAVIRPGKHWRVMATGTNPQTAILNQAA